MHATLLLVSSVVIGAAYLPAVSQDVPVKREARKVDEVVVVGCLQGTTLQTDPDPANTDSLLPAGLGFRLQGKRGVMKELAAHDGQRVEITGVLKSKIERGVPRGITVGKTRIRVGGGSTVRDAAVDPSPKELMPLLEVLSFEVLGINCRVR